MTILIVAGLGLLVFVVLGILIGRGAKDLRALKDEQRTAVAREQERPQARAGKNVVPRSGFKEN